MTAGMRGGPSAGSPGGSGLLPRRAMSGGRAQEKRCPLGRGSTRAWASLPCIVYLLRLEGAIPIAE
jgi:hypothetical protein